MTLVQSDFDARRTFDEYVQRRVAGLLRHAMTLTGDQHDGRPAGARRPKS